MTYVWGQPDLQRDSRTARATYTEKPCLEKEKKKKLPTHIVKYKQTKLTVKKDVKSFEMIPLIWHIYWWDEGMGTRNWRDDTAVKHTTALPEVLSTILSNHMVAHNHL